MRILAADIGGTSIRAHLVTGEGDSIAGRAAPTPQDPAKGIELLRSMWDEMGGADARALVVAGAIHAATGEITQSPNLPHWEGIRPGEALDCIVLNDANGALLGEAWLGSLADARSALLLTLGTGVGGAVLIEGELWPGATGSAGEIGHFPVRPDGPHCACGGRGCLELYASALAVAKAAGTQNAEEAARLAREGEPRSRGAFRTAGEALGVALAGAVNLLNPEVVCFAGGMSSALDLLETPLRAELEPRAFRLATRWLEIRKAKLGSKAGILGAARAALESIGKEG